MEEGIPCKFNCSECLGNMFDTTQKSTSDLGLCDAVDIRHLSNVRFDSNGFFDKCHSTESAKSGTDPTKRTYCLF